MQHLKRLANAVLAEDRLADIALTQHILEFEHVHMHLHVVRDGGALLQFLHQAPPYDNAPEVDIIFLDLHLHALHGNELLAISKKESRFQAVSVIVLSGSDSKADIASAKALGADAYIVKPISLQKLREAIANTTHLVCESNGDDVYVCRAVS